MSVSTETLVPPTAKALLRPGQSFASLLPILLLLPLYQGYLLTRYAGQSAQQTEHSLWGGLFGGLQRERAVQGGLSMDGEPFDVHSLQVFWDLCTATGINLWLAGFRKPLWFRQRWWRAGLYYLLLALAALPGSWCLLTVVLLLDRQRALPPSDQAPAEPVAAAPKTGDDSIGSSGAHTAALHHRRAVTQRPQRSRSPAAHQL